MITSPSSLRRSERSRRATLDAALELCTEKGYGRVTIEAIAARAGVSKKTIYRWWPSKGAVMLEAFTEVFVGATPFVDTGDIAADLRTHINGAVKMVSTPPYGPAYAGILSEMHHDDDLARAVLEQLVGPRFEAAVGRLRGAQEQGQVPAGADLPLAVEMLYGPVYYRHVLRTPAQDEATVAALVSHVLRSLAGAGDAAPAGTPGEVPAQGDAAARS
ncbi:TetR/AcrR family transcriptional regulator [Streptomyces sp. HB132]|uniref:TetR/AcrR family transcriptional regulator n=1 Tax=Streptomyces sp. HB132 TaxID=767388 RepID=UPI0019607B15|nr:TetR/AcrR family transcriptional regulator [Streptomyces sp. HB132]MBM7436985.1 AcrR family transcriptional regulator [Streptomyces sp. HB132]